MEPETVNDIPEGLLEREQRDALNPMVPLTGGGHLWIESTHAMTVVDVNSGGNTAAGTPQETFFKSNCVAAEEIARQLRIRNIGGMVIVDFIGMRSQEHRNQVVEVMKNSVLEDRMAVEIHGFTRLGLLELTRKHQSAPLREVISEVCPQCGGTGRCSSATVLLEELHGELRKMEAHSLSRTVHLELGAGLYALLKNGALGGLQNLGSRYGLKLSSAQCPEVLGYRIIKS